ncbi:MAG: FecR family protein [Spirochaetes bacterium]|jgi:hypothetical protein|nr:FecR family protein [Spirochaetota bacterium]
MIRKITVLIVAFVFLSVFCGKQEKKEPKSLTGFINFITGTVKIIDVNAVSKNAEVGDEIKQGMKIETIGETSIVEIYFNENAIKVMGNSIVTMEQLLENIDTGGRQVKFFVDNGRLFSRVAKKLEKNESYIINTPTTTAAVRGTEFIVSEDHGKANVACLTGMVEVLNNSIKDSQALNLNPMEETDVIPGQDMIKKDLSDEKLKMYKIVADIKAMKEDIRMKFEKQMEGIRKHVDDQRSNDKAILEEQKTKDKALVEDREKKDKQNIEDIKGKTKDAIEGTRVDKQEVLKGIEELKQSVKPKIQKFDINKDNENSDAKQE